MSNLILVRHGQSEYNLENRFTGWRDVGLTDLGRREAYEAGEFLKGHPIDMAFTSVLIRAEQTLDIILKVCGLQTLPVVKNIALNERAYGQLEGLNKSETAVKYGNEQVHLWRRSFDIAPPGGESLKDTYDRVVPYFINTIQPLLAQGKNVLVVAHGNSLRALIMYLDKLTPEQIVEKEIATGKPVTYTRTNEEWAITSTQITSTQKNRGSAPLQP